MSIIDSLVYNRTDADMAEALRVRNKILSLGLTALTDAERTAWLGGMKAAYNYTDLNRVGQAVTFLRDEMLALDIHVSVYPKTDWTVNDTPSPTQMTTYLQNVETLRAALPLDTEATPTTMRWLSIQKMNTIERILSDVSQMVLNIQNAWFGCGEVCCGET